MEYPYNKFDATAAIKGFYNSEEENMQIDTYSQKCTLKMHASSLSMFNALSERFGVSRFELLENVLNNAAKEMFEALNEQDKIDLAAKADTETSEYIVKQGVTTQIACSLGTFENEDPTWRLHHEMLRLSLKESKGDE